VSHDCHQFKQATRLGRSLSICIYLQVSEPCQNRSAWMSEARAVRPKSDSPAALAAMTVLRGGRGRKETWHREPTASAKTQGHSFLIYCIPNQSTPTRTISQPIFLWVPNEGYHSPNNRNLTDYLFRVDRYLGVSLVRWSYQIRTIVICGSSPAIAISSPSDEKTE
jgi:hypothetical protein